MSIERQKILLPKMSQFLVCELRAVHLLFTLIFLLAFNAQMASAKFDLRQFLELDNSSSSSSSSSTDEPCWRPGRHYFGTRNVSVDGFPCLQWAEPRAALRQLFLNFSLHFFPDEYTLHNYCRDVNLEGYRRIFGWSNATLHLFRLFNEEWRHGPWCYVEVDKKLHGTSLEEWNRVSQSNQFWPDFKLYSEGDAEGANVMPPSADTIDFVPRRCFRACKKEDKPGKNNQRMMEFMRPKKKL